MRPTFHGPHGGCPVVVPHFHDTGGEVREAGTARLLATNVPVEWASEPERDAWYRVEILVRATDLEWAGAAQAAAVDFLEAGGEHEVRAGEVHLHEEAE